MNSLLLRPNETKTHDTAFRQTACLSSDVVPRALQWSGNPYGNGYGVEMDGNGTQFVKMFWIGLDLGQTVDLK